MVWKSFQNELGLDGWLCKVLYIDLTKNCPFFVGSQVRVGLGLFGLM